jgi:hypothetical protein
MAKNMVMVFFIAVRMENIKGNGKMMKKMAKGRIIG